MHYQVVDDGRRLISYNQVVTLLMEILYTNDFIFNNNLFFLKNESIYVTSNKNLSSCKNINVYLYVGNTYHNRWVSGEILIQTSHAGVCLYLEVPITVPVYVTHSQTRHLEDKRSMLPFLHMSQRNLPERTHCSFALQEQWTHCICL